MPASTRTGLSQDSAAEGEWDARGGMPKRHHRVLPLNPQMSGPLRHRWLGEDTKINFGAYLGRAATGTRQRPLSVTVGYSPERLAPDRIHSGQGLFSLVVAGDGFEPS